MIPTVAGFLKRRFLSRLRLFKILYKNQVLRTSVLNNWKLLMQLYFKYKDIAPLKIISLTEHIGDIVASEPVSLHVKALCPKAIVVWVINEKYKELVEENPNINVVISVTGIGEWILLKSFISKIASVIDLHLDGKPCNKYGVSLRNSNTQNINIYNYYRFGNLLQAFTYTSGIAIEYVTPRLHFNFSDTVNNFNLPDQFIVIHCRSNEASRCWDDDKWNIFVNEILDIYPNLSVIEIGLEQVIKTESKRYINYCSKFNLKQNSYIIRESLMYIGIDSGFAHFANAYEKESVIMIGHYRQFKRYMPFSGYFESFQDEHLLYYDGELHDMPVRLSLEFTKNKINRIIAD